MKLVTVQIQTFEGSLYEFPDMDEAVLINLLTDRAMSDYRVMGKLSLVNISHAIVLIPFHIIQVVFIEGVEKWRSPVSTAETT